jgi:Mn2+/Fe2+ NRAMP family transporter
MGFVARRRRQTVDVGFNMLAGTAVAQYPARHKTGAEGASGEQAGSMEDANTAPPVPATFWQYVRSLGPGLIVALTWLGAGDLVDSAVAGGNYGYTLMWAMVIALFVRYLFVSIIAKYQLCNQHGESVMAGIKRLHPWMPVFVGVVALFFGHFYGSYLVKGVGEVTVKLVGFGVPWAWSVFWVVVGAAFIFRGAYRRIEIVFYVFLAMLSVSLIGVAGWSGPDPVAAAKGVFLFDIPEQNGPFGAILVITSLIGAVGGSIANLMYPYFMQQKGWQGPRFRRLQHYDLALGTAVLVFLNLSVWTIGAEVLNPRGITIESLDDLATLLTVVLGELGGPIFYLGVFAALYSSVIGGATGFGYMVTDIVKVCRTSEPTRALPINVGGSRIYRAVAAWCLFTPLVWSLPGMPGFIALTIIANAAAVVVLPVLCGALWILTARGALIGEAWRNKWWENALLAGLFILSIWGATQSIKAIAAAI